ncbi:MAG: hypothetical protein OWU32_10790, partial [Firmicutes bacterium]|nr:hypothetical protein [Bacillota bacterium]
MVHYLLILFGSEAAIPFSRAYAHTAPPLFNPLLQWDALWYAAIGRFGYAISPRDQYLYLRHGNIIPFSDPLRATAFFP